MANSTEIKHLQELIGAFVRGPDRSIVRANEIEVLMDRLLGSDERFGDVVVALASYRPEGGPFLNDERQMVSILESALKRLDDG